MTRETTSLVRGFAFSQGGIVPCSLFWGCWVARRTALRINIMREVARVPSTFSFVCEIKARQTTARVMVLGILQDHDLFPQFLIDFKLVVVDRMDRR